jgi:DNA-binding transcriptional LysR family regulator
MDFRQLSYFIAVAEERHLGRAAERLCMSQSPLTRKIQALEAELGVTLFHRTPRGMVLTQAGQALLKDALNIRGMVQLASERAQRAGLGQTGQLGVGIYGSAVFGVVTQILVQFAREHPQVDVIINHEPALDQVAALRQGRVALVFERWLPDEDDIASELVAREPLLLAVSERHPLASRESVDVEDLREETLIVGAAPLMAAVALDLCRSRGFKPRFAPAVSDVVVATIQAAAGLGVSLVPASMTNVHLPGIAYKKLNAKSAAALEVYCYYLKGEDSPLFHAMLRTVRAFAGNQDNPA